MQHNGDNIAYPGFAWSTKCVLHWKIPHSQYLLGFLFRHIMQQKKLFDTSAHDNKRFR